MTKLTKIAIVMIIISLLIYGRAILIHSEYDWIAFSEPISVENYGEYVFNFISQKSCDYEIEFATKRVLDYNEQSSRLGFPLASNQFDETLLINWKISNNQNVVASGTSTECLATYGGSDIGKVLGKFPTQELQEYTVFINVEGIDSALAVTEPKIRVRINRLEYKSSYVSASLWTHLAILIFLPAILILIRNFVKYLLSKRVRQN